MGLFSSSGKRAKRKAIGKRKAKARRIAAGKKGLRGSRKKMFGS